MTFTLLSVQGLVLCVSFFAAGIIDAVCGGGGLLTLPMFMTTGIPTHLITGTNQCCILFGSATSTLRFARSGHIHWRSALLTVPFAMLGSALGAQLNMRLPAETLELVMLLLVPIVAVTLIIRRDFGAVNRIETLSMGRQALAALAIGLIVGTYQGFYGAGSGTFFMLGFAVLMRLDLTTASGTTKVVSLCSILTSAAAYAMAGQVIWTVALAATVFNVAGSYVGSGLALTKGAKFIRPMFLMVLAMLFVRLAWTWLA